MKNKIKKSKSNQKLLIISFLLPIFSIFISLIFIKNFTYDIYILVIHCILILISGTLYFKFRARKFEKRKTPFIKKVGWNGFLFLIYLIATSFGTLFTLGVAGMYGSAKSYIGYDKKTGIHVYIYRDYCWPPDTATECGKYSTDVYLRYPYIPFIIFYKKKYPCYLPKDKNNYEIKDGKLVMNVEECLNETNKTLELILK